MMKKKKMMMMMMKEEDEEEDDEGDDDEATMDCNPSFCWVCYRPRVFPPYPNGNLNTACARESDMSTSPQWSLACQEAGEGESGESCKEV